MKPSLLAPSQVLEEALGLEVQTQVVGDERGLDKTATTQSNKLLLLLLFSRLARARARPANEFVFSSSRSLTGMKRAIHRSRHA